MSGLTFFDLLGVRQAPSPRDAAAARWPLDFLPLDPAEVPLMVDFLEAALTLQNVRPGATPNAVGLVADLLVGALTPPLPLRFASMPKVEFFLLETSGAPARLYAHQTTTGVEWIVESLPVEIFLPDGFLAPLDPVDEVVSTDGFQSGKHDSLKITLRSRSASSIKAHIKLRVSEQFDFILEFATPISIGPCRFSGIPCAGVHDLAFILTPNPSDAMDSRAEALEWLRHELNGPPTSGFITARTVDLTRPAGPLDEASKKANETRPEPQHVEAVLEDVALLASAASPVPFPMHFTAGVRRTLGIDDNPNGIYDLTDHPVTVALVKGSGPQSDGGLYLILQQFLIRSFANGTSLDNPQTAFVNVAISDDPNAKGLSATVEVTDEWTLEAGLHIEPPKPLFTLFGVHVKGAGVRAGVSFKRLFDGEQGKGFFDAAVLLADLHVQLGNDPASTDPPAGDPLVKLTPKSGKPTKVVVNGIGYKFGSFAIGDFWQAEKTELTAAGVMRLSVDEFGFVTEPNGARYFSFSGTWPVFGTPTTQREAGANSGSALGIQFYRLRWKIHGPRDASELLLDGLGLAIQYRSFSLIGFGMLSDRREGSVRFREAALALEIQASIGKTAFTIGGQFLYGRASGAVDYRYLLAGLKVSPIPITGAVNLVNVRGLFAWNMQPRLGPIAAGNAQPMRLFDWYLANLDGVSVPATRNVATTGWEPKENAWAFAAGAGVELGANHAVKFDAFFLYVSSPEMRSFLAALQVFAFGSKKPIAYGVVEVDGDRWSLLIGLNLGLENVTGKRIPVLGDAVGLTGTIYATNQPATIAIGHLNDLSSWLALRVVGNIWIFKVEIFAGVCLELVDVAGGPRVFAIRVAISGGSNLSVIGSIDFMLALQLIVGVWRSESKVSGFVQWLEGSIRINVLWVFRFGASFKVEWAYLGPDPAYRRIGCEVHIHTPWWMPDKTFRWNRTLSQPSLPSMSTASAPLLEASAHPKAIGDPVAVSVSRLAADDTATFSIANFLAMPAPAAPAAGVPVAIDSTIALHFKPSVDDKLIWGQITPPGMGQQSSGDVSTRYELVELGIRRRPRSSTAAWTTLLDPTLSRTDNLLNVPPQNVPALAKSPVAMRWDADFQREQRLDPRHLLLNAELPYLFVTANFQNDENLVRNMPGWPCCPTFQKGVQPHILNFDGQAVDARAPRTQRFSSSTSALRWLVPPPVVHGPATQPGPNTAQPLLGLLPEGALACITLDKPASNISFMLRWQAMHVPRALVISLFRGLKLVNERSLPLSAPAAGPISFADTQGITHAVLRVTGAPLPDAVGIPGAIDVISISYRALDDVLDDTVGRMKCGAYDPTNAGNGSRFAWLPNHDYEIQIRTRVTIAHPSAGSLQTEVPQVIAFRTKGLPGLNAAPRVGQELDPYVESVYPRPGAVLYRREPAALAFNEQFDILQGLDHPVSPGDPAERQQRLDWILAADVVDGNRNPSRASVPAADWIVAHRGTATPPSPEVPVLGATRALIRHAVSLDPLRARFNQLATSVGSCNQPLPPPRKTRVLVHDPADPTNPDATLKRWPRGAQIRMNLRVAGSPFVDRQRFETADATALTTPGGAWEVVNGALAPANPGPVRFAVFGESSWEHVQIEARIDDPGARAGVAIAVDATSSMVIWIDETQRRLRIVTRTGDTETEVGSAGLSGQAPYILSVAAYDDDVRAAVGPVEVSAPRGTRRAGRVAFVAEGAAVFSSVHVDGLDAYRFEFTASRFDDLAAHVGSFSGAVQEVKSLAPPAQSVAAMLAANATFDQWVTGFALPLRTVVDRLEISRHTTGFLLVESPDPLGPDVAVTFSQGGTDQSITLVRDSAGRRILVFPSTSTAGDCALTFRIDRPRYRASTADSDSNLRASASVEFVLPAL